MITYKFIIDGDGVKQLNRINENGTVSAIPQNEENTDYQEYIEWVAEGNTPEPADE